MMSFASSSLAWSRSFSRLSLAMPAACGSVLRLCLAGVNL